MRLPGPIRGPVFTDSTGLFTAGSLGPRRG